MTEVRIAKTKYGSVTPCRAHNEDAGADLYAAEDVTILPGRTKAVGTGIHIELPENTVGMVCERSGLALEGVRIGGGIIDYGYTGEIGVIVSNHGRSPLLIDQGDKIAQLLILPVLFPEFVHIEGDENDLYTEETDRGSGGFGSTGRR